MLCIIVEVANLLEYKLLEGIKATLSKTDSVCNEIARLGSSQHGCRLDTAIFLHNQRAH
jgi:hypothetical protein